MTRRSKVIKGLMGIVIATSLTSALPGPAAAQTSPWWPGDSEVILGYGCTAVPLEPYDRRFSCPTSASHVHEGIDIDLPYGTPIHAGWPGTVVEVGGREAHDYGPHYVKVWLDEGHDILLGHLSQATVVRGQRVEIGTLVGYVGDLGVADIPNLDFGARPHGGGEYDSIDPSPFLAFVELSLTSQSYAGRYLGGQIQVLARSDADGRTWSMDLAGTWTGIADGPSGGFAADPVVAGDGRGHLIAFASGVDGALWTSTQLSSTSGLTRWKAWVSLGRPAGTTSTLIGQPAIGLGPDGRLDVFVRASDATLWESRQTRAGGRWSPWGRTPFAKHISGDPVVAGDSAASLEVFAPSKEGRILVNRQAHGGGRWMGWVSLGMPAEGGEAGFSGRTAVVRDSGGLLEAFVVTTGGSVFASTQAAIGQWTPWTQLARRSDSAVAAVLRPDRRVQVFALNGSGTLLTTIHQGRTWTPWITLGHGLSGGIATTFGANGSLLVLGAAGPHSLVVRSGDPQQFDGRAERPLAAELADARGQAWTSMPPLPRSIARESAQ